MTPFSVNCLQVRFYDLIRFDKQSEGGFWIHQVIELNIIQQDLSAHILFFTSTINVYFCIVFVLYHIIFLIIIITLFNKKGD